MTEQTITTAGTLAERAMLVSLSISRWTARATDKIVSEEVATAHGSDPRFGAYRKRLLPKQALAEISAIASEARAYHYEETLPWLDKGARILPARNFVNYTSRMRDLRARFDDAVGDFVAQYEDFRAQAKEALNGLYREEDYPTQAELAGLYAFETIVSPMPDARDFRVALADEDTQAIRAQLADRAEQALAEATKDIWTRAKEAVERLRARLAAVEESAEGTRRSPLHATAVEGVRAIVGIMERLNLANDPAMEKLRQELDRDLCALDVETLKEDAGARQETMGKADALLAKLAGYAG
jgi:hypothetical protein